MISRTERTAIPPGVPVPSPEPAEHPAALDWDARSVSTSFFVAESTSASAFASFVVLGHAVGKRGFNSGGSRQDLFLHR